MTLQIVSPKTCQIRQTKYSDKQGNKSTYKIPNPYARARTHARIYVLYFIIYYSLNNNISINITV